VTSIHEHGVDISIQSTHAAELPAPAANRRIKYDVVADQRLWMEVMRWLHDHLAHLIHPEDVRLDAARDRLAQHEKALTLAREDPRLAVEAGVGRPDLPGAFDGGVVDINHAPVEVIACLPNFDADLARRLIKTRQEIDGFASLGDLGIVLDLPGNHVERLRDHVVFLPI
jgi:DNA uptake protein ComE-like DNA-binding protein